jgi:hypothetical protein
LVPARGRQFEGQLIPDLPDSEAQIKRNKSSWIARNQDTSRQTSALGSFNSKQGSKQSSKTGLVLPTTNTTEGFARAGTLESLKSLTQGEQDGFRTTVDPTESPIKEEEEGEKKGWFF